MMTLFGTAHLLILAAIISIAALLVWWVRDKPQRARATRYALAGLIIINELSWYMYTVQQGWFSFPRVLPLHLCDLTLWLTVISLLTLNSRSCELAYYWSLAGTSMAILMPEIGGPFPSYPTLQFFGAHGMVVISMIVISRGRLWRPPPSSALRAFIALNAYALLIGAFNAAFDSNYMFLCVRPASFSILDYFGPWPVYLVVSDLLAAGLFFLLYLPHMRRA